MKRLLALALCLALAAPVESHAGARQTYVEGIKILRNRAASVTGSLDSTWVQHATALTDTTTSFILPDRAYTPFVLGADSLALMDVELVGVSGLTNTPSADTAYFTLQGSVNGSSWVSGPQVAVLAAGGGTQFVSRAFTTTRTGGAPATATNATMGFYPIYRFITVHDATGPFQIKVRYWKDYTRD